MDAEGEQIASSGPTGAPNERAGGFAFAAALKPPPSRARHFACPLLAHYPTMNAVVHVQAAGQRPRSPAAGYGASRLSAAKATTACGGAASFSGRSSEAPSSFGGRRVASLGSFSGRRLGGPTNGARWRASRWLENSAQAEVPVALEEAWALWEDRELIPNWMPWITSVKVQPDDPRMSRWTLSTTQFNRQWEFSWLALNMTPLKHQKLHWRSVPGSTGGSLGGLEVQNRGQIRFVRQGAAQCSIKLTISYEVPSGLAPFANLLTPVVEGILQADMKRFAEYALQNRSARA